MLPGSSWRRLLAGAAAVLLYVVLLPSSADARSMTKTGAASEEWALARAADMMFLSGVLVFFMQVGFLSLESGYVRSKNVINILMKNTVDALLCGLVWWAVGYAFSHGSSAGGFIGASNFFYQGNEHENSDTTSWFFSWTFVLCCVSIVGGCLAERTNLQAYAWYTIFLTGWIHPVVAHWTWYSDSWLNQVTRCDFLDFAGGAVVHIVGGLMGTVGAIFVGPRIGRFEDGLVKPMPGHDVSAISMGTFALWFGWYGFNCGSAYSYGLVNAELLDRIALNMSLSACTSGLTSLVVVSWRHGTFDLCKCCNSVLAGLVSATATCGFVTPWASVVMGICAGACYLLSSKMFLKLQIDDPLDSGSIHFVGGAVGTLLNGAFAHPEYVQHLTRTECGGFFYSSSDRGLQLGTQILSLLVVTAWVAFFSVAVFATLRFFGQLRIDQTTELAGIDNIEHGGQAYPEFNLSSNAAPDTPG